MKWHKICSAIAMLLSLGLPAAAMAQLVPKPVVQSPRLYMLDCGALANNQPETFQLSRDEVQSTMLANMCFFIVHPKGTLIWDTGIPDWRVGRPLTENIVSKQVAAVKVNTVVGQLADIGYTPANVDYLALSHYHWDHSGNSNAFAGSTWLVSKRERDAMFGPGEPVRGAEDFALLKNAKTVLIDEDHDVFGDGTVVIKQAFGHTPGHSVLLVKLKNSGPIILAGDLYHHPEELTLNRMPKREETTETPQSRTRVLGLARQIKAQVWIAHDPELFRRLRRGPLFYD